MRTLERSKRRLESRNAGLPQSLVNWRVTWKQIAAHRQLLVRVAAGFHAHQRIRRRQVDRRHVRTGLGQAFHAGVHGHGVESGFHCAHPLTQAASAMDGKWYDSILQSSPKNRRLFEYPRDFHYGTEERWTG